MDYPVIYNTSPIPCNLCAAVEGAMRYPFARPCSSSFHSSRSSSSESDGNRSLVSPWSNATGYSYEGTHSLAKAARERCAVQHTVSGPEHPTNTSSPSSVKHDLGIDYVRRAQERIKAQQPIRRPRFQDLVDKQAEELATTISLSTSDSTSDNTEFGDMMMADCSFRPSSRMWDKGWDDLLKDTETEAPASWIVHAPRAIKPVNAAEMFELLAGGTSS